MGSVQTRKWVSGFWELGEGVRGVAPNRYGFFTVLGLDSGDGSTTWKICLKNQKTVYSERVAINETSIKRKYH